MVWVLSPYKKREVWTWRHAESRMHCEGSDDTAVTHL